MDAMPADADEPIGDEPAAAIELLAPDLDIHDVPVTLSLWLVEVGQEVTEGDRIVELVAGGITVDLPSPVSGILAETRVLEDELVTPGIVLGVIAPLPESAD